MVEKRKFPRISSINLSYVCLDKKDKILQQAMGRTLNISEKGFLIETHFPMEREYTLAASIGLKDDTIDIKGKIVHCQSSGDGKYIAGVEITFIDENDRSLWKSFIGRVFGHGTPGTDTNK